jgi:hypothetical protein
LLVWPNSTSNDLPVGGISVPSTVHRLVLDMAARHADALATAIAETSSVPPEIAKLQAIALAGVFQFIVAEAGRRAHDGTGQAQIADELHAMVTTILDELDRWFSAPA